MPEIRESLRSVPVDVPGVYRMIDLDGVPAYAGETSDLRGRLRQHFVRQDSSVVSYGRLDIWDIAYVDWWETENPDRAERALLSEHRPYLNFDFEISSPKGPVSINMDNPDGTIQLVSERELAFRSESYNRAKQKLDHISRMLDKIKISDHSDETKETLYEHQRIFHENLIEFLNIKPEEENHKLTDWSR